MLSLFAIVLLILGLGLVAWLSARAKAAAFAAPGRAAGGARAHSLPAYHGWYVALWALVPALIFLTVWSSVSGGLVTQAVLESPAAASLPQLPMQRASILSEAQALAVGLAGHDAGLQGHQLVTDEPRHQVLQHPVLFGELEVHWLPPTRF